MIALVFLELNGMKMGFGARSTASFALLMFAIAQAQTHVVTMRIGQDQIGLLKTARGITTRLSFRETPFEIICGDLYDPNSGTGGFVVQRSGNDVFLKPVVPDGISNLFVKTGEAGKNIYSFDLVIVSQAEAFRIVYVLGAQVGSVAPTTGGANAISRPPTLPAIDFATGVTTGVSNVPWGPLPITELPIAPPPMPSHSSARQDPGADHKPGGVSARQAIKRALPDYPEDARLRHIEGEVVVQVGIDDNGKVVLARALAGNSALVPAALSAARKWIFTPASANDSSRQNTATITFEFRNTSETGRATANSHDL